MYKSGAAYFMLRRLYDCKINVIKLKIPPCYFLFCGV